MCQTNPEIKPLIPQLSESKKTVRQLWEDKNSWVFQNLDLQIFDREANQLQSICGNQSRLLDVAELGVNLF